ncbi:MAG: DUF3793 family protein [Schwartzia sp.]|nr:DUF3793 family protein [Schwartzia sp. (in: firmicutes)]
MTKSEFEMRLGRQCAPTFLGLKVASLVAFHRQQEAASDTMLADYEPCLACHGVSVFRLVDETDRALVLFYRAAALDDVLRRPEAQRLLAQYGYRESDSLDRMLRRLRQRVTNGQGFPHEIGLFLGYPPHDVRGFIEHKGRGFLCCGPWKVYEDAEAARALFRQYADCTAEFCTRLAHGVPMAELLEAV